MRPITHRISQLACSISAALATSAYATAAMEYVRVGDPNNAADPTTSYGAVDHTYWIGKYEVTNAQYAEFLNAKGQSNANGIYNSSMASYGITQSGSSGSYSYTVTSALANRPVVFVSWFDAARFANWMNNGQGNGDMETGAYTLNGASTGIILANAGAEVYIPSEDKWYKAAYYNGANASYSLYPNGQNSITTADSNYANSVGSATNVGTYGNEPSFYGTFDQGGNAVEWNDAVIGSSRGLRGGAWYSSYLEFSLKSTYRDSYNASNNLDLVMGFRVAAASIDTDSDGVDDLAETNTGIYISPTNTGTNPNSADTDGDGVPDGLEVKEKTSPVDATKFNSFSKGMVSYYPFSGNAYDEGIAGYDGIVSGATLSPDRFGNADRSYFFNGSSGNYISNVSPRPKIQDSFTLSFWFKASDADILQGEQASWTNYYFYDHFLIPAVQSGNGSGVGIQAGTNGITVIEHGNWFISPVLVYPQEFGNSWIQTVVVIDNNSAPDLWVNGRKVRTGLQSGRQKFTDPLSALGQFFHGSIDDLRIYNRALASTEVAALYSSEAPPKPQFPSASSWIKRKDTVNGAYTLRNKDNVFITNGEYSNDGIIWNTSIEPAHAFWLNNSAHGNGIFIRTGAVGQLFTSTNFKEWTIRSPGGVDIVDPIYGNGTYIARQYKRSTIWLSRNNSGSSWENVETGVSSDYPLCFGNNIFLLAIENQTKTSPDGINWNTHNITNKPNLFSMDNCRYFDGLRFIGAASTSKTGDTLSITTATSLNGSDWIFNESTISSKSTNLDIVGAGSGYIVLSDRSQPREIWISNDVGLNWKNIDGPWNIDNSEYNSACFFAFKDSTVVLATSRGFYSASITQNYNLTAGLLVQGSITGTGEYAPGTSATLTATPNSGYIFSGWTGDASGTSNPLSLTMDANKMVSATFAADLSDSDVDGLTAYDEVTIYHTDPTKLDSDNDGLTDAYELGIGRFSVVSGTRTWAQAKAHAETQGGTLATFANQDEWNLAMQSIGSEALLDIVGLWIGATDEAVEGTWRWVTGEPFVFSLWETGQPDNSNNSDYAAVAGDLGGSYGKWYDYRATTSRDGYILEYGYSTNPSDADSDDDGLPDGAERTAGTNPFKADTDGDGLTDAQEVNLTRTNPNLADSNSNGTNDALDDQDSDSLTNLAEITQHGTDPINADTDLDGINDGAEVAYAGSFYKLVQGTFTYAQAVADATAKRGRVASFPTTSDYARVATAARQTTQDYLWIGLSDTANEGTWVWTNGSTAIYSRWVAGQPSGGATENRVVITQNSTQWADSSEDFQAAGYIFEHVGLDPLNPDTDADGLNDGVEINTHHSSPVKEDTDGDGLSDGAEVNTHGSSPLLTDTDSDGLSDRVEVEVYHSNPALKDSDGDGYYDAFEVNSGFNPALATSTPDAVTSLRTSVEFRFNAADGVSYRIEASTDLENWSILETDITGQSAEVTRFYSTENQPKRHFRVRRN